MSAFVPASESSGRGFLSLLPALTVLALVNLFASQALVVSDHQAAQGASHADARQGAGHGNTDPRHSADGIDRSTELPVLAQLPPFSLTERSGAPLSQADLAGKVWVADFIFTSCTAECPLMSAELQKLQAAFASSPELRLVSFSVDPETDTPAVLRDYASKYGADAKKWLFATGDRDSLYKLAIDGFKLPVQDLRVPEHDHGGHDHGKADGHGHADGHEGAAAPPASPASSPFLHSQKFVLVDDQLRIRGYYDSTDVEALRSLIEKDLPRLLNSL